MKMRELALMMLMSALVTSAYAAEYELDQAHTAVTFKIRHLLSNVNGSFDKFDGKFSYTPNKPEE